ncbi:MAG: phosphoglycerate dehydrogenase [Bacteroidetes bacterium]|nr:phosphoglycerate dehydrogenase [Bacteroidota bacterium]
MTNQENNSLKIGISTSSFGLMDEKPIKMLKEKGYEVILNPHGRKLTTEESKQFIKDMDGLIAGTEDLSQDVLNSNKLLKVISRCGVDVSNVDLNTAKEKGITVCSTPDAPTEAVAELALGLILALLRFIPSTDRKIRAGEWKKSMGNLLQDKTLGVVGLGRIGRRLIEITEPFNLNYLALEVFPDTEFAEKSSVKIVNLDEITSKSDIISVHVPLSKETKNLIGIAQFDMMKPSSIIIHTSRGGVVDESALETALREKKIAGAGLDVYESEPYEGPLREFENVVMTAHMGSYAKESRIQMETMAAENLISAMEEIQA